MKRAEHVSIHALRRLRAGELTGSEAAALEAHHHDCGDCRQKAQRLEQEVANFAEHVSFERFAAGLEQKARAEQRREAQRRNLTRAGTLVTALAAGLVLLLAVPRVLELQDEGGGFNRLKGSAVALDLRIAGTEGTQRSARASGVEPLLPGDRVRIGYRAGPHRYVAAVSLDAHGVVSPLYPERGESLPVEPGDSLHYLPESLEFTGAGLERVIVVLSDEPLDVERLGQAVKQAYTRAGGDLQRLGELGLSGTELHRTLLKP